MKLESKLIDRVQAACHRLARAGWQELMLAHGINLLADDLATELLKPLESIRRDLPGFEDFALEGNRGIAPGKPAYSLLFHAFASPQVLTYPSEAGQVDLKAFPFPSEIEAVENYVYGVEPPSLQDLHGSVGHAPLSLVVFACEYRPAVGTVHRLHADMCFSRTGIARVGTKEAAYLPDARGYLPFAEGEPHAIRVIPCRYAAYLAVRVPGEQQGFGPMDFHDNGDEDPEKTDDRRLFWVPIHKLFSGKECLRDHSLTVTLTAHHINQKLRKAHLKFAEQGLPTHWQEPAISQPPFLLKEGLAEFSTNPNDGEGLLIPYPHKHLVAEAMTLEDTKITYLVPRLANVLSSSVEVDPDGASDTGFPVQSAPEYLHARSLVESNKVTRNLNREPEVANRVGLGGYQALHYVDYTADGWIEAQCTELGLESSRRQAAYSVVAPPDFFPAVKQQELIHWWKTEAPADLKASLWPVQSGPPKPLSDTRLCADLELKAAHFDSKETTISAVIALRFSGQDKPTSLLPQQRQRSPFLPDGAAGVMAPGWDCSADRNEANIFHLANYGMGSPFPEDAKLCAALSSFWPAVAPDVTRSFEPGAVRSFQPQYATATPLTDVELGMTPGSEPWDGVRGPERVPDKQEIKYHALDYGDYVESALKNKFYLGGLKGLDTPEYVARTLAMARAYQMLGATTSDEKLQWAVFSFTKVEVSQNYPYYQEFLEAQKQTSATLTLPYAYRFEIYPPKPELARTGEGADFDKVFVGYEKMEVLYADSQTVLRKLDSSWEPKQFPEKP